MGLPNCVVFNYVLTVSSTHFSLQPEFNVECEEFFVMNLIIFVLSKSRNELLTTKHLTIRETTKFDTEQKFSKFLLEIMTLVSAYNIGSDVGFVVRESHLRIL
jgi:hypothetical protein